MSEWFTGGFTGADAYAPACGGIKICRAPVRPARSYAFSFPLALKSAKGPRRRSRASSFKLKKCNIFSALSVFYNLSGIQRLACIGIRPLLAIIAKAPAIIEFIRLPMMDRPPCVVFSPLAPKGV